MPFEAESGEPGRAEQLDSESVFEEETARGSVWPDIKSGEGVSPFIPRLDYDGT